MNGSPLDRWRPGTDGAWDRAAAAHLFRRAGFGPEPGEVDRAVRSGLEPALEELLARDRHDPARRASIAPLLGAGDVELLAAWWLDLCRSGGAPLRERMTLLWHDHFATSYAKVGDVRLMHRQNETLRELALGDFRELLHAVARDPAMLVWLDGDDNRAGAPNENFARELMELFALGRGNYGEGDVKEAARALTGWGTRGRSFVLRPEHHDGGSKTIFGHTGAFDGDDVIDLVLAHPACPRWIARRLLVELCHPEPTAAEIDAASAALLNADWHIGRTVERILRSRLFFGPRARRARVAAPVELIVSALRALDASVAPAEAARAAAGLGQSLFRPPSVKGWDGGRSWIDAGTWIGRVNAMAALANGGAGVDLAARFGPKGAGAVPDAVLAELLPEGLPPGRRAALEEAARAAPDRDAALRAVTTLVLTSPEFHLY